MTFPVNERMTPDEAAEYLGVKSSTLRDWRSPRCASPSPIYYGMSFKGAKVFYLRSDLDKFMASRRVAKKI